MTKVGISRRKRTNTGRYLCPYCKKTFTSKENLQYHTNSHNDINPFKCNYCDKAFKGKGDRYRHEKNSCTGRRRHQDSASG
ncbi:hypothetical protein BDQ17DRAFT_1244332 [Cyathus striatus]|nr:hypothetical protein BDQ17DRAFT_1266127 [Cyathus striatus]KAF9001521.1 hypothetical protein BDQ17DRAFT_1244332 [Cyathus striatus]